MAFKKIKLVLWYVTFIYFLFALLAMPVTADENESQRIEKDKQLFIQAVEYSAQQQWLQAEPLYRDLIQRHKTWPEPANNLAVLLLKTQRIDEAKLLLEQAVRSSEAYRIAQQNRTQLYNFLATQAYAKALGEAPPVEMPEFEFIKNISQSVKIIEVEKIVIQKEFIEPPAKLEVPPQTLADVSVDIEQQLLGWSKAWSESDFDTYIQFYSTDFSPSDASKDYAEWRHNRRVRIRFTKGVQVDVEKIRAFLEPQGDYALVEFVQNYRSNTYSDKVLKQMYMHYQQDEWLILSERTIKVF